MKTRAFMPEWGGKQIAGEQYIFMGFLSCLRLTRHLDTNYVPRRLDGRPRARICCLTRQLGDVPEILQVLQSLTCGTDTPKSWAQDNIFG